MKVPLPFASNEACAGPAMFKVTLFVGSDRFVNVACSPGAVKIKLPFGRAIVPAFPVSVP